MAFTKTTMTGTRNKIKLTCKNCGIEFEVYSCYANRRKNCSKKCHIESQKMPEEEKERNRKQSKKLWYERYGREYNRRFAQENYDKYKLQKQGWKKLNRDKANAYAKKYREKHPDKVKIACQKWEQENRIKRSFYAKNRLRNRIPIPSDKLNKRMRNSIRKALNGNKNGRHWETLVGYTLQDLIKHLEPQFKDGMNWKIF